MARGVASPGRVRRRLVVAFVLAAGLSSGALAIGSFLLVRDARLDASLERAEQETRFGLRLAADLSPDADLRQFVSGFASRGIQAVAQLGDARVRSDASLDLRVPPGVAELVAEGEIAFERRDVDGVPSLVTGGRAPGSRARLFFFFSEAAIREELENLRNTLLVGWVVVLAGAALVGRFVAARTLAPVGQASRAARSIAEGLLETRLPESGDEFGAWAHSFNEMAAALESKIEALQEARERERRFTGDVAHELRTPVAALVGEASVLRAHLDAMPPDARRVSELLVSDVARLRRLLDELMEIFRLDSGVETVAGEPVDVGRLIRGLVRSRGWDHEVSVDADEVVIESDRLRLERIIGNLVDNAVGHGGGGVTVGVARDDGSVVVEVADRGPGIPPEHVPRLFDRFYKADPSRSSRGSGLGLSIAQENARLLGGRIDVWSRVGQGTRFTLRLPVTAWLPGGDRAVSREADDGAGTREKGGPR